MILSFRDQYSWLSNFAPVSVKLDGTQYPSVENAYQAAKFPPDQREPFLTATPGEAKRLGKRAPYNPDWDKSKVRIMRTLIVQKFSQEPFRTQLLQTEDRHIEEGNTWGDTFWGTHMGEGRNELGKLIMQMRASLAAALEDPIKETKKL